MQKLYCPRLDHFVRFNYNGKIGKCGHMIGAPGFESWNEMQDSQWLKSCKEQMYSGEWPLECQRCQRTENSESPKSIRLHSIERHQVLSKLRPDYLILGGVLDNICNSACQSCNADLSTKIGSLESKSYKKINNEKLFNRLPVDRVLEIDLNGGEPTASPAYQNLLHNLPTQVKILRVNTNGSRLLPNIESILQQKIKVIITLSLDGVGKVHDYVRWPITWEKYTQTVQEYVNLQKQYKNLKLEAWTTVHALNVNNFDSIVEYAKKMRLDHDWAFLVTPTQLDVSYSNNYTLFAKKHCSNIDIANKLATGKNNQIHIDSFINTQDNLRNISIKDYL